MEAEKVIIIPIIYPWLVHDQISLSIASYASRFRNCEIIPNMRWKDQQEECEIIYTRKNEDSRYCQNCVSEKIDYIKKASEEAKITNMRIIRSLKLAARMISKKM